MRWHLVRILRHICTDGKLTDLHIGMWDWCTGRDDWWYITRLCRQLQYLMCNNCNNNNNEGRGERCVVGVWDYYTATILWCSWCVRVNDDVEISIFFFIWIDSDRCHSVVYIQPLCDQHSSKIIVYRTIMIKNGNLLSN